MLFDRDFSHGSSEIDRLRKDFPKSRILTKIVNVIDVAKVERAVEETAEELGSVDILCCFAGVVSCAHTIDVTAEEWKRTFDVNTTGAFLCAQTVARYPSPSPATDFGPETNGRTERKYRCRSLVAFCSLPPFRLTESITHNRKPATMPRKRRCCR